MGLAIEHKRPDAPKHVATFGDRALQILKNGYPNFWLPSPKVDATFMRYDYSSVMSLGPSAYSSRVGGSYYQTSFAIDQTKILGGEMNFRDVMTIKRMYCGVPTTCIYQEDGEKACLWPHSATKTTDNTYRWITKATSYESSVGDSYSVYACAHNATNPAQDGSTKVTP